MTDKPFWKKKSLKNLSRSEWESLCDGCGRCCLHKIEDIDTGDIALTNVSCCYLDVKTCRCSDYDNRKKNVSDCVSLTADLVPDLKWLPETCGYRLVAEGRDLHWWHPLLSGKQDTVHRAGISVRHKAISEDEIDNIEDYVQHWVSNKDNIFKKP